MRGVRKRGALIFGSLRIDDLEAGKLTLERFQQPVLRCIESELIRPTWQTGLNGGDQAVDKELADQVVQPVQGPRTRELERKR